MADRIRHLGEKIPVGNAVFSLVFCIVLCLGLLGLSRDFKERLHLVGASTFLSPLQELIVEIRATIHYSAENERLRQENAKIRTVLYQREQDALENIRLRQMLEMPPRQDFPTVSALVIARDPSPAQAYCTLNVGLTDSVFRGMPVFTSKGLVGRVLDVTSESAQVMLLNAPESRISVLSQRSRVGGILQSIDGQELFMLVPPTADLQKGDVLITSGWGGVYPKGMPVGIVAKLDSAPAQSLRRAYVRTFQEPRLFEEAFVLKHPMKQQLEVEQ
jgi:rod shape-determining protein MreC